VVFLKYFYTHHNILCNLKSRTQLVLRGILQKTVRLKKILSIKANKKSTRKGAFYRKVKELFGGGAEELFQLERAGVKRRGGRIIPARTRRCKADSIFPFGQ
jgi:hypothetical protein